MNDEQDNAREADTTNAGISRRTFIKGAVAAAGIAGFPYVHAQEKITLRYLGTAVNQSAEIAKKFKEDTGIEIQYIPVTTDDVTKRIITQPNSFDIVDTEYFSLKKLIPAVRSRAWMRSASSSRTRSRPY